MPSTTHDAHQHSPDAGAPAPAVPTQGSHDQGPTDQGLVTLAVATGALACEGCARCVQERLRAHPHVIGVHVDTAHEVAHVTVHEGMVTADELAETVAYACGDRNVVPLP